MYYIVVRIPFLSLINCLPQITKAREWKRKNVIKKIDALNIRCHWKRMKKKKCDFRRHQGIIYKAFRRNENRFQFFLFVLRWLLLCVYMRVREEKASKNVHNKSNARWTHNNEIEKILPQEECEKSEHFSLFANCKWWQNKTWTRNKKRANTKNVMRWKIDREKRERKEISLWNAM